MRGVGLRASYDWSAFMVGTVTYNWAFLLAFIVFVLGLVFLFFALLLWCAALLRGVRASAVARDPFITGTALVLTAFAIAVLFGRVIGDELFSDAASSVSNAPG